MRRRIIMCAVALAGIQLGEVPAFPHHSNVAFAVETVHTATGVVKEWRWMNPHTWLIMDVDDGKGATTEWAMEGRAPGVLLRAGWSRSIFKPGDKVTAAVPTAVAAQSGNPPPDFSGVYYPLNPFGGGGARRGTAAGGSTAGRPSRAHEIGALVGRLARTRTGCAAADA